MFLSPILALSLPFIADASVISENFGSNIGLRALDAATDTTANVLGPVSHLHIANEYIAPDGYNRSSVLANGVFPGPLIWANKGDRFAVKIFNELTDDTMPLNTSVHWHGIFQRGSNWADGTSYVTQCPIPQQRTFVQKFNPDCQTGTYWYHSHYSVQYCDGLRGPLVIYDPEDPLADLYDVDDETTIITLSDWYHEPSTQLLALPRPTPPDSTLINGKGRYSGGPSTSLAVVNVTQGLRYRFRVISMSCDPSFNFTIDGHRMTIIEADGVEVEPVEVDSIPIYAGQRYSVIITANNTVGNYWIRALNNAANASFDGGQNMAILRYDGAADEDPTSDAGPYDYSFDEGSLHPLIDPGAPGVPEIGAADVSLVLEIESTLDDYFSFNNMTYTPPTVPVLLQILSGARQASELLPNGSVYTLPPNKIIEISFPNPTTAFGFPHPIHLHGHNFDVVRVAGSNATNFVNPVRRDVVSIGSDSTDNVTIRFVTNNPGPWILHCHIDRHLNRGLAIVFAEATNLTAQEQSAVVPSDWIQLCQY